MPPVSGPQGSRTALVTWAVIFAILFVTSAIFAIYFYADSTKAHEREDLMRKRYADVVTESDLQSESVASLKEARQNAPEGSQINAQMPLFTVSLAQRDELAHTIGGPSVTNPNVALDRAKAALAAASNAGKGAQVTVPATDNLANALTTMANTVNAKVKQVADLQAQLEQAKKDNAAQAAQFEQQRQEMAKTLEGIRAEQQKAIADVASYQQNKDQSVQQIQATFDNDKKQAQDQLNAANVQMAELNRQLAAANQKIETLQAKFADKRINTEAPIVRHPDGHILRLVSRDTVYIDIGQAESVTPGLTFEVYDKNDGIPPAGDPTNDDNLPKGKAAIEVIRVGQGSSECRITRTTLGTQIQQGDLIANLVYDPNVKYNFVVYGDFDMDRNGVATPQEADIVKRLVTQWGGKLMDQVNVDTDFVVLGKEPVLPTFTKEELQDPFNQKKLADAQAALDAYQKVRDTARDLHIPIVNQNRFLYLIGYYEQAKR